MGFFIVFAILVLFTLFIILIGSPFALWFQALVSGAQIGLLNIVLMRFRKVPAKKVVEALIIATKAGVLIKTDELEAHHLAGGDIMNISMALVAASKADIYLPFDRAAAMNLAGINVLEAVQTAVNPIVINTSSISGVTKDGQKISAVVNLTVRADIDRLLGGAGTDTILSRTCESFIELVASIDKHKKIVENPDMISKRILEKGVDSGTAYEILSVDIVELKKD